MTRAKKAEREEYRQKLLDTLKPGDTLYTVLRSCSRSGMSRTLDIYQVENGEIFRLTHWACAAADFSYDNRREALRVGGCGMDMGFHVVYNLSSSLWPNGFGCIGKGCPSNDHSNGDRDYTPHQHTDGGYALRHRWL